MMFQSQKSAGLGSNSRGAATQAIPAGGHSKGSNRTDHQNLLAFAIILLLCALVFLIGGALTTDTAVKQADLTADTVQDMAALAAATAPPRDAVHLSHRDEETLAATAAVFPEANVAAPSENLKTVIRRFRR